MTEREKVIKGLECCNGYCDDETGCPYYDIASAFDCEELLRKDAIAMLKAQEPRVIPRNDLLKYQDYAWVEFKRASRLGVRDRDDIQFLMTQPETEKEYNKTWRCWTSRPDEKRRAETPWE